MTLANQITIGRLLVTIVHLVVLAFVSPDFSNRDADRLLLEISSVLFLVAAVTDFVDGYVARTFSEVTDFGRIADPFVDKILVCGSLILVLGIRPLAQWTPPWMVVVIVSREFLVHGLRATLESRGIPFGASFWGKLKTVLQCIAVAGLLFHGAHLCGSRWVIHAPDLLRLAVGLMLVATVVSGLVYLAQARRIFQERKNP